MSALLTKFREKFPEYAERSDEELTQSIGAKFPQYLQDAEFRNEWVRTPSNTPELEQRKRFLRLVAAQHEFHTTAGELETIGEQLKAPEKQTSEAIQQFNAIGEKVRAQHQEFQDALAEYQKPAGTFLNPSRFSDREFDKQHEDYWSELQDRNKITVGKIVAAPFAGIGRMTQAIVADVANIPAAAAGYSQPLENLKAGNMDEPLPAAQRIEQSTGAMRFAGKAGLAIPQMAPRLVAAGALSAAGAPSYIAAGAPMLVTDEGELDPVGAAIAAALPGVSKAGEALVAKTLSQFPVTKVAIDILGKDPLKLKGKVTQKMGGIEISNDQFRKFLEAGGGLTAANAYLLATQAPQIAALPPDQQGEAILDAVAQNIAPSLLGFVRPGLSKTLETKAPEIIAEMQKTMEPTSKRLDTGAPQVEPGKPPAPSPAPATPTLDPSIVTGKPTTILGANDAKLPAVYAWVPIDKVQASHAGETFSQNPAYAPLKNTRRYHEDQAEREKVLKGASEFQPESYTTNVKGAAEGPVMVSQGSDGIYRVLGGNGRFQMIQRLSPEQREAFGNVQNEEAAVFGLPERPSPDHVLVRMLPQHDVSTSEGLDAANRTIDLLNPSPGLVENVASMARNDAGKVSIESLRELVAGRDDAGATKEWMAARIAAGDLDRNTRTQILSNESQLADYAQRLLVNAAYRSDAVTEFRNNPNTGETVRGLIDSGVPFVTELRAKGENQVAEAFSEMLNRTADYQTKFPETKLDDALQAIGGQQEAFDSPAGQLAQDLALALSARVERLAPNKRGELKIDADVTRDNFRQFFDSLARSVKQADNTPDLFGGKRTPAEIVRDFVRAWIGDKPIEEESDSAAQMPNPTPIDKRPAKKETTTDESAASDPSSPVVEGPHGSRAASAASHLRRTGATGEINRSSPGEIERQATELIAWARDNNALLPKLTLGPFKLQGAEHEVFHRASDNRAVKRTYPGTFGGDLSQGAATPLFYLRRLELMNEVFDSDFQLEGVTLGAPMIIGQSGEQPSFIVSQPWIKPAYPKQAHPSEKQIAEFMERMGFEPKPGSYFGWERKSDGTVVIDAKADNFILTSAGVVPIDLVIGRNLAGIDPRVVRLNQLKDKGGLTESERLELDAIETALGPAFTKFHREQRATEQDAQKIEEGETPPPLEQPDDPDSTAAQMSTPALTITFANAPKKMATAPLVMGGMQHVRPVEFPELVKLAKELMGSTPALKKFPKAAGMFYGRPGAPEIKLHPELFKSSADAAKVLAHEMGHLIDFLPDPDKFGNEGTLKRGNVVGRLMTLRKFLKDTMGTLKNPELRDELLKVTQYWHPYNPATAPAHYVKYRESAVELYADALSVLFNSPGLLEQMAPKFYRAFWQNIDRKPDVKRALFDLQDFLSKGKINTLQQRAADIQEMFLKGEELLKRKAEERELRRTSWKSYWAEFKQQLFDKYQPVIDRAREVERKGGKIPPRQDPRNLIEEGLMTDNTNARFVKRMFEGVVKPVEDMGLSMEDLGQFLFLDRIRTGRSEIANPLGITPEAAREQMLKMRMDLGLNRMTLLQSAVQKFHDLVFESVREGVKVGSYNKETFSKVIEPNKDHYAAFAVLDYLEDYVPAGIREQVGTLKDIANPFTATVLKTITLNNLNAIQRAKNTTRDFLRSHFPAEIQPAPVKYGQSAPPAKQDRGIIRVLEDGEMKFYYVDPFIAEAFERGSPLGLERITRVLDFAFRKFFYPLFITYNPTFQFAFNPKRDFSRTWRNMPKGVGRIQMAKAYADVWKSAKSRAEGLPDNLATEMMANFAIGTPFDSFNQLHRDDQFADLLRRYHFLADEPTKSIWDSTVLKPVRAFGRWMEFYGMVLEGLPKMAAYKILTRDMGMAPKEAAGHIRNFAGTPNVFRKGKQVNAIRGVVPFFNVFLQGWRSDLQRMTSPKTAGGWWFKWAMNDGLLAVLTGLAVSGVLGAGLKSLFDGISEYDKTNYIVIPVGWTAGGDYGKKVTYIRIPRDESSRVLSGMVYKLFSVLGANDKSMTELFDFGAGQIPSVNPAVQIPVKWSEYLSGDNPEDPFRGRPIIPSTEFEAGGLESLEPMALWTLQQSGASSWIHWNKNADTTTELTMSAIPGLNRLVKTSDYGYREQQMATEQKEDQKRAQHRLAMPDNVQKLLSEYFYLRGIDQTRRTPAQLTRYETLNVWYNSFYKPADESVVLANDAGEKDMAKALRKSLGEVSKSFEK